MEQILRAAEGIRKSNGSVDADDERAARRAGATDVQGLEVLGSLDLVRARFARDLQRRVEHLAAARRTHRMLSLIHI